MTSPGGEPNDAFRPSGASDPFETRLAGRVARHADHGVRPIDAMAIAETAAAAGGGRRGARGSAATAFSRLGWLLAGAVLAAGAIGGTMWAAGQGLLGTPVATPSPTEVAAAPTAAPTAAPSPTPSEAPNKDCALTELSARITGWSGAAGNRIATVVLTNTGPTSCVLATLERPQLVDGTGKVLIDGTDPSKPSKLVLARGEAVTTEVDAANYCGATPSAPVTVAFLFASGDKLVAEPRNATDTFGVPDCLGPGGPGLITMHPWAP